MSNKMSAGRSQLKLDVPTRIKDKLEKASAETSFSMTLIVCMLVEYYLGSPLDVEHDVRRTIERIAEQNKQELKLSPRQKRVIENVAQNTFTDDLV